MWNRIKQEFFPTPDAFDLARGVQTSGLKGYPIRRLLTGRDYRRYQPINEEWFQEAIEGLPRHTFIDMGCGRGRALILAHEAGFKKLIGVEFSPSLCRDARRNLRTLGIEGEITCQDATAYTFPDEPCVVFFYNPFGAEIMRQVIRNIGTGHTLIYVTPKCPELFNRFHVIKIAPRWQIFAT